MLDIKKQRQHYPKRSLRPLAIRSGLKMTGKHPCHSEGGAKRVPVRIYEARTMLDIKKQRQHYPKRSLRPLATRSGLKMTGSGIIGAQDDNEETKRWDKTTHLFV